MTIWIDLSQTIWCLMTFGVWSKFLKFLETHCCERAKRTCSNTNPDGLPVVNASLKVDFWTS